MPRFSVVIPCFNAARYVAETIDSVIAQTERDLEIIAVDNNSTDDTRKVLDRIAAREPRLRIVHEPVQGLSAARNGGIRAARGRLIAFLDADDIWDGDFLARHGAHLERTGVDISYGALRFIDADGRPTGKSTRPPLSGITAGDLLVSNPCTAMIVVKADVFARVGLYDETLRRVEDQEWLFRAVAGGARLEGIEGIAASYRVTPGGLSSNVEAMLASHRQMLERAARVAPELVASRRRIAEAAMLRYCARRSVEHGGGRADGARYLLRMIVRAPQILIAEPAATARAVAYVLLAGAGRGLPRLQMQTGTSNA